MKILYILLALFLHNAEAINTEPKTIHLFVALCDNANQGIVPVPAKIGNSHEPYNNLYWGAMYGVKSYFKNSNEWTLVKTIKDVDSLILERVLFKHKTSNTYYTCRCL